MALIAVVLSTFVPMQEASVTPKPVCKSTACHERVARKKCSQRNPRWCIRRAIITHRLKGWQEQWMYRVSKCESGWNPYAKNRSSTASGLFQFLTSTWAGTPYGDRNVFRAKWNALAAAWMLRQGRSREWVCS